MLDLQPHQKQAVEALDSGKILWGGVGVGKSRTAVAYYLEKESPRDVYVITTAKKRDHLDWDGEFARIGVGRQISVPNAGLLVVESWNNIGRFRDVQGAFFIFDEQRLVGSGAWTHAFLHIARRNRWILLSATPGDSWLDYIPVFIANGYYKNRSEFKREHVIYAPYVKFPKVERYVNVTRLVRQRNAILVEMPFERRTERVIETISVEYDKDLMMEVMKKRWNPYADRPIRNVAELFSVMRRVANSHSSRLGSVRQLLSRHSRLIVFYNFDYELEILRSLQVPGVVRGEWNGHIHQPVPSADKWVYLVQYTAGAEGWNCIATDAMAFYSLPYSYKSWHQAHGRTDRMNTPFSRLFYYVLMSNSWMDLEVKKNLDAKRDFNQKAYMKKFMVEPESTRT